MDELTARPTGRQIRVAHQDYASIAYGWAMEDTTGFAKIIVDAETTEILGAHLIGPEATTLIQLLIQAMSTGQTARDLATTDRKSTRLNSSHVAISYAVFCLKKKKKIGN